ncbi:MAG: FAD/NAD(P)-binding oxidoreductase [Gemmatimonadota bacterium]|jgi:NADPH-dependent 2,4-dienoyl-CoA reductase/sulfur reductase-like enzyme
MPHHKYLIVGGGMAADAAVRGIRELDEEGRILIVTEEPHPPYARPPLSKGLWKDGDEASIWRDTEELGVDIHVGRRVTRIDPDDHTVTGDRGVIYTYQKLLLATGGEPVKLADASPQVMYFRSLEDYRRLRKMAREEESFVVVGGSFIGSELAAALALQGKDVTMLFPEEGICRGVFPPSLSDFLTSYYRERGVDVRPGVGVASVRRSARFLLVATDEESTQTLRADGVVAGIGIRPNDVLADTAGLDVVDEEAGGGIIVDAHMRTSAEDVYAAGDAAAVWCPPLGKRMRFEHEDQALSTGLHAGRAMAGADEEYDRIPFFYSDLFDLGYEAVGELDPSLQVVEDWADEFRKGVLYYLDDGRLRGVLLWNVWGKLKQARALIRSGEPLSVSSVRGRISLG